MNTWKWTGACLLVSAIVSGSVFFSLGEASQADDAKVEPKATAAKKVDIAPESGYGSLVGQFVLAGNIPELPPAGTPGAANGADIKTCGGDTVPDERLVVDKKTKGIANIFVYLKKAPTKIHPSLAKPEPVIFFDQKICQFLPHAFFVRTGQTVKVLSDDPVAHNTFTHPLRNDGKNSSVSPKDREGKNQLTFVAPERLPIRVDCSIHRWMVSWWLILDHPYAAITDAEGKFAIGKLPAGDYEFTAWQETAGYIDDPMNPNPKAPKFKITIPDNGTVDKKQIQIDVSKFKLSE